MTLEVEVVARGLRFPEGPVVMADGSVLVVEIERGTLSRVSPHGEIDVVADLGGGPNGVAIGPDGAAFICNNGGFEWFEIDGALLPGHQPHDYVGGSIQRVDLASGEVDVIYKDCDGVPLRGPNDLVFDSTGGFWFTDHGKATPQHRDHGTLHYARPDGSLIAKLRGEMLGPNGVGLSPDETTLYVAETPTQRLWAFDVAAPGELKPGPAPWLPGRLVATLPHFQLLDSLAVEADGRVCVGTLVKGGITVFGIGGEVEHLSVPSLGITNIAFGGLDLRDAWLTDSPGGKLYRCRWPRPGLKLAFNI